MKDQMVVSLDNRTYPELNRLRAVFYSDGQIVMVNASGEAWNEHYYQMPNWFEKWYPELVADLKARPIPNFPVPIEINDNDDQPWGLYVRLESGWLERLDPRKIIAEIDNLRLD